MSWGPANVGPGRPLEGADSFLRVLGTTRGF